MNGSEAAGEKATRGGRGEGGCGGKKGKGKSRGGVSATQQEVRDDTVKGEERGHLGWARYRVELKGQKLRGEDDGQ